MQVGDKVKLKSGGPVMTVEYQSTSTSNSWKCVWWNGEKSEFDERFFFEETLNVNGQ